MTREEAIKWFEESPFYHKDHKPFNMAIKALSQESKSPCDLCRYNPPSSTDGKSCTMCPAEGRAE